MRAALYWVPALDDPLYEAGVAWLGRDAETGARVAQPEDVPGIAAITADARRYGLHATLLAPAHLSSPYPNFADAARGIASACAPFDLPPLEVCEIGGFLALRERAPCPALHRLAEHCVLDTAAHRMRPNAAEFARRRAAGLTARQDRLLDLHFYPYVLDEWFFHVTLTRRLTAAELPAFHGAAIRHFEPVLDRRRRVTDICVCTQLDEDFLIAERMRLGGEAAPQSPA